MHTRREVIRGGLSALALLTAQPWAMGCGTQQVRTTGSGIQGRTSNIGNLGPLGPVDANGLYLPAGFTSRIVGTTGAPPTPRSGYLWHPAPDGGATFATQDGGWVYVSNSEYPLIPPASSGGVGALRFDHAGTIVDAYPILTGTSTNCAGGATPWGTWLSCEEIDLGRVWECDPLGQAPSTVWPALGVFKHEAVAVDPVRHHLYLTEDQSTGRFYRFTPSRLTSAGNPDLSSGTLEVMRILDGTSGPVAWHEVPDPSATGGLGPTRTQVPESTVFNGGEGLWYHDGFMYFSTKGDDRIWVYDLAAETISILYDRRTSPSPILRGVDNVTVSDGGDVLVAEDGDDMQVVAITPAGQIVPVVQVEGHRQSEVTGPAFSPNGDRLYFSSQRGAGGRLTSPGITYEVTGPFFV